MPRETGKGDKKPTEAPPVPDPLAGDRDTGSALRSVYQATVEEAVPAEMLDLLGRLD